MSKSKIKKVLSCFWRSLTLALFMVVLSACTAAVWKGDNHAEAATSSTINFQARLLAASGSVVPDGDYNVEFKLYNASSSSGSSQGSCSGDAACLWTETRTSGNKVRVINGYLTVNLGSVTSFPAINWDQELWLTMNIGGTGSPGWDGEMSPRLKLTAVPYAFRAGQLVTQSGSLTSTLSFAAPTSTSKTITIPNETGTICLQSSSSCGFLTPAAGNSAYIQNTTSPQTANFNITGDGVVGGSVTVNGNANVFQSTSDSATAFQILNNAGNKVFVADTSGKLVRVMATGSITSATLTSGTGAVQIGPDNNSNLALDDNELMVRNNGSSGTMYLQRLGGGLNLQADTTIIKPASDSATAFQVQNNSASARVLGVDTSGNGTLFGQGSGLNAKLVFYNSTNNNTITIQSGTTSSSYTMTMPTALGASGDCIKDTTGTGVLGFGACGTGGGGGGGTLQNAYDNSGTANPQITLSNTNGGIKIRDSSGGISGNLLQLQNSAGTATYFGISASALTLQDASGNNALLFDSTTSHLRVYADATTPTAYADIYYDAANSEAIFTASSGTTRIGSGSGNITMQLTAAADLLQATKTVTLGSAYSSNDFTFTRNITAAGNSLTGSVVKIESTSTGSSTLASNIVWINENNNSATGNLILATKNGAGNEKFKVDVNGAITAAGSIALASGQTVSTGSGALGVSAGSGNLTLTAGGANTVIAKPGTDSTAAFQVQNAGSTALFTADTTNNRLQVGSSTTDSTAVIHILDSYNQSTDPTGVNGAMYYNTNRNTFRCYENSTWKNCMNGTVDTLVTSEQSSATFAKAAAGTIVITPLYIPGQMTINEMRVVVTTGLGAAGDIGIYNSSGTLVINGGSGSLTTGTGIKTVAPTQSGSARVLEAGQYYLAVTWNSATGNIRGTALGSAMWPRNGTLTGGGSVLPSSVTLSSITSGTSFPLLGINN